MPDDRLEWHNCTGSYLFMNKGWNNNNNKNRITDDYVYDVMITSDNRIKDMYSSGGGDFDRSATCSSYNNKNTLDVNVAAIFDSDHNSTNHSSGWIMCWESHTNHIIQNDIVGWVWVFSTRKLCMHVINLISIV